MKRVTTLLMALLVGGLLQGCGLQGTPLTDQQMPYAGTWENEQEASAAIYLQITPDGMVNYQRQEGTSKVSINAPIKKWEGNDFWVGAMGVATRFRVSQPPTQEGDVWVMVVDDHRLLKYAD